MSSTSSKSSYSTTSSSYNLSSKSSSSSISSLSSESAGSKTNAFFGSPFSSASATPSLSSSPPKEVRVSLSRLFPSRFNSDRSLTLPTPVGSPRRSEFATLPSRSSTVSSSDSGSASELTPRPESHIPTFLETQQQDCLTPGSAISSPSDGGIRIKLVRTLGQGAFSNVWLGEDVSGEPLTPLVRSLSQKKRRYLNVSDDGVIRGIKPCKTVLRERRVGSGSIYLDERDGDAGHAPVSRSNSVKIRRDPDQGRLVAVKMTPRVDEDRHSGDRTRVSFVREVEVLKHISHPYITLILGSFTTPTHHALVLPYLPGSDLLALVNSDELHAQLSESVLRIIWRQLCSAVGWMHGVGLVHRDIKLENILLTQQFPFPAPTSPSTPLIKLTDFGLSRFIDLSSPLLSTRCGSEAYAAPELVIRGGKYDGRETDAWACGVVLYGLVARRLPFDHHHHTRGAAPIGRETEFNREGRRSWLMRIAKGEWSWPTLSSPPSTPSDEDGELLGSRLVLCDGARRVTERLLVRNSKERAKIDDMWANSPGGEPWMGDKYLKGSSSTASSPTSITFSRSAQSDVSTSSLDKSIDGSLGYITPSTTTSSLRSASQSDELSPEDDIDDEFSDDDEGELPEDRGCLVDKEGIDGIACREVV